MILKGVEITNSVESHALPNYLKRLPNKKLVAVDVPEFADVEFDAFYNFGLSRSPLTATVPQSERIRQDEVGISFVSFKYPEIAELMHQITRLNKFRLPEDSDARLLYQHYLYQVFEMMGPSVEKSIEGNPVFFPPLNGGALIEAYFWNLGIISRPDQVAKFELKRMHRKNGDLMVGVRDHAYPAGNFSTGVVLDDCLASDVSASTSIDKMLGLYPSIENILVVISAATQKGVESLLEEWKGHNVRVIAGVPVFSMNPDFYLMRTKEEGYPENTLYVGDMGKWAKPLSQNSNYFARWNEFRSEVVGLSNSQKV